MPKGKSKNVIGLMKVKFGGIYNIITTEKQQKYQHYRLKIDEYEFLTGEEILPPDQRRVVE